MHLFMTTGIKREELCEINIENVDLDNKRLVIIKDNGDEQIYYLTDKVAYLLSEYIKERNVSEGYLFQSNKKARISPDTIRDLVNKYTFLALGEEYSPQQLRSGVCSILYNETKDIEFVRKFMGHANLSSTIRYISKNTTSHENGSTILGNLFSG